MAVTGIDYLRGLSPLGEPAVTVLYEPFAWLGRALSGVFSVLAQLPGGSAFVGGLSPEMAGSLSLTLLTLVPAVWGVYRVVSFLRE